MLQDEQDQAHARLLQAIAKLNQVMSGFHSTLGNRAKKEFMKPDGKIGSLSGLVHEQDSVGAARWLWELGDHRIDSESMLARVEGIVYERDPQAVGNKRIKGVRRRHCLSAIDQIIGDTRDWVARSERLATVGEVDYLEKQALDLGRELEERIAAIEANPEPLDRAVSRPLFEAMKRRLEILWTQT